MKISTLIATMQFILTANAHADCPSLDQAREAYRNGNVSEAQSLLKCAGDAGDAEALRYASDISWWENQTEDASEFAERALTTTGANIASEAKYVLTRRVARARLNASLESVRAERDTGTETFLRGSYRYSKKHEVSFSYLSGYRDYSGATKIEENLYRVGHTAQVGRRTTLETGFLYGDQAIIFPRFGFDVDGVHYFENELYLSLGGRRNLYEGFRATYLTFGLGKPLTDQLSISAKTFVVVEPETLTSFIYSLDYLEKGSWGAGLNGSSGRSIEGPGLFDQFSLFGGYLLWSATSNVNVKLSGSHRTGDIRSEKRLGLGLEWLF